MEARNLAEELKSRRCRCGKAKERGNSFCRTCYYALPKDVRNRLYRSFGNGYEEAYDEAYDEATRYLAYRKETRSGRMETGS